ncbi:MAG: NAD-dependent epimerase/dehydratase family protein [Nevskiales bacterium]
MRIAVLGATGLLGQHAARAALARGHELIVIRRASSNLQPLADLKFRSVVADLNDTDALAQALDGAEAVINCAAYYPTVPRPWREEVATALTQMDHFYAACARHSLKKIVYLGGAIALRRHPSGEPGDETLEYTEAPANKNSYLQVKWAMDAQARRKAQDGLPVVIGIPTMSFGDYDPGSTTGRLIVEIANRSLPGYVKGKRNVIYAGDAGIGLVRVCEDGRAGERYLLTGSNVTMDELVARIAQLAGVPAPRAIPLPVARVVASVQALRYKCLKGPLPKVDATAIAVMSAGQFLSGAKAERELGFRVQTSLDDAIRRALAWFKQTGHIKS